MKRRPEHLVQKRDGRREFLRATKLARSIHLALHSVGVDEDWRALELANVVLQALRQKREARAEPGEHVVLTTAEIADAVQHLLVVTGQPHAAAGYLGWLELFGNDPANLLYFPTFYAEAGAILGFHACLAGAGVALLRPTRVALAIAAVGAAIDVAVASLVAQSRGLRLDGDAALALELHRIEHLLAHLALRQAAAELDDAIRQGRLAVVDVRDDGEVADVLHQDRSSAGPAGMGCSGIRAVPAAAAPPGERASPQGCGRYSSGTHRV